MIDVQAWVRAARRGEAVGRCAGRGCNGFLFCPGVDGMVSPFHDRTDPATDVTIRWYEAECHGCHAVYAYPNGRDASDGRNRNTERQAENQRQQHRGAQRVSEFIGAVGGQT